MILIVCVLLIISIQISSSSVIRPLDEEFIKSSEFREESDVCQTEECMKTAEDIISNMDSSVNPCVDFFQFACGGFVAKRTMLGDEIIASVFSDIDNQLNLQIENLLKKELTGSEPEFVKMLKDMYDSCMDEEKIEKLGGAPLQNMLDSLGGWPVVKGEQWDSTKFDWLELIIKLREHGYSQDILVETAITVDVKNNTQYIINLDQPIFGTMDRTYLINGLSDPVTNSYFDLMVKAANKLDANDLTSREELLKALEFEMALASYSLPSEERRNISNLYNKLTVQEVQELAPQVNWLKYLNGLFSDPIPLTEKVLVIAPEFLKKFAQLIVETDKRTIANYMIWRVVKESLSSLSKEWRDVAQDHTTELVGVSGEEPRWRQCMRILSDNLPLAIDSYYIRNYFKDDNKDKALVLVEYIRKQFLKTLENVEWMQTSTKSEALEKAKAMTQYIGYPQELLNDSLVMSFFKNLTINKENYFHNILNIAKLTTDNSFSMLREPHVRGDWRNHARTAVVNAFYSLAENSIEFPAGIFQNVFFNKDRPYYSNFGGVGYVIGHEITHGFDDIGRQFDKMGNNIDWWDETTDKQFRDKAKCIIEQYGNYTTEIGLKLNGINTQGENIADNGGLKGAYLAYQSWVKDNYIEQKLPGLSYTPNQLFWISAANIYCSKYTPEALKFIVTSDSHSPSLFRVLGPISNLPEFANDFQCAPASKMNPTKKCQVW